MVIVLVLIVILLLAYLYMERTEKYRSCRDCEESMAANGTIVLNPFVWPYSGTQCIDDIYILNKDTGVDIGTGSGPLTHPNTPDHVILTN